MNIKDAAKILGLNGEITAVDVVTAYRKMAVKYHPDRNPTGEEMMKAINAAYEALKGFSGSVEHQAEGYNEALSDAISLALDLRLASGLKITIEIMGAWLWLQGETKPFKEQLKEAGFKWAPKKKCWYFRPEDYRSFSRGTYSLDEIKAKYGTITPEGQGYQRIQSQ